jgi:hypothetical protein
MAEPKAVVFSIPNHRACQGIRLKGLKGDVKLLV